MAGPFREQLRAVRVRDERRALGQVRRGIKAEESRAAQLLVGGIDGAQVLSFVVRGGRIAEAADAGVRAEQLEEERRAAPMEAANERESAARVLGPAGRRGHVCGSDPRGPSPHRRRVRRHSGVSAGPSATLEETTRSTSGE